MRFEESTGRWIARRAHRLGRRCPPLTGSPTCKNQDPTVSPTAVQPRDARHSHYEMNTTLSRTILLLGDLSLSIPALAEGEP